VLVVALPNWRDDWRPAIWVLVVVTLVIGSILAVVQTDRRVRDLLDEDLGERSAAPTRGLEHLVDERAIEHDPRCY